MSTETDDSLLFNIINDLVATTINDDLYVNSTSTILEKIVINTNVFNFSTIEVLIKSKNITQQQIITQIIENLLKEVVIYFNKNFNFILCGKEGFFIYFKSFYTAIFENLSMTINKCKNHDLLNKDIIYNVKRNLSRRINTLVDTILNNLHSMYLNIQYVRNCLNSLTMKEFYDLAEKYVKLFSKNDFKILLWLLTEQKGENMKFNKEFLQIVSTVKDKDEQEMIKAFNDSRLPRSNHTKRKATTIYDNNTLYTPEKNMKINESTTNIVLKQDNASKVVDDSFNHIETLKTYQPVLYKAIIESDKTTIINEVYKMQKELNRLKLYCNNEKY
jgi:hypothetical protein